MRRYIFIFIILAVIGSVSFAVLSIAKPVLRVDLSAINEPTKARVLLDGNDLEPTGSSGGVYEGSTSVGSRELVINHPSYGEWKESVSMGLGTKTIKPELPPLDPKNAALSAYKDSLNVVTMNEKLFDDGRWVVFTAGPADNSVDGVIVVSRFNSRTNEWEFVAEGSSISSGDYSEPVPEDVKQYVESL